MSSKTLGSILIVVGTAIGAGMLATPIITAAAGFSYAALLMIALWALMCISALLTAEAALAFPAGYNGFNTMARETLGKGGQAFTWLAFLGLLYALNSAYISGGGSILSTTLETFFNFHLPQWVGCVIFLSVFGAFIYWGARSVDLVNRVLISIKGIIFIISMTLVTPYIELQNLASPTGDGSYLLAGVPILITAFGFHVVVPSLVTYNDNQVSSIVRAIVIGSFIPLIVYLIWLAGILGVIPLLGEMSFNQIVQDAIISEKDNVGLLLITLSNIIQNHWIAAAINFFSHLAITTSFLGVGLALFDFLIDVRKDRQTSTRIQTILLTFIPPLLFALYFPQGFILALGFAGIFVSITCIILPALFAWKTRNNAELSSPLRIPGGTPLLVIIILFGIGVIGLEILDKLDKLPTLAATLLK